MDSVKESRIGRIMVLWVALLTITVAFPQTICYRVGADSAPYYIRGYIYDTDGVTPLAYNPVTITNVNDGQSVVTTTNINGYYQYDVGSIWNSDTGDQVRVNATDGTYSGENTTTIDRAFSKSWCNITLQLPFTFNLSPGWNLITLPLNTSYERAEDLAKAVGVNCTHVGKWNATSQNGDTILNGDFTSDAAGWSYAEAGDDGSNATGVATAGWQSTGGSTNPGCWINTVIDNDAGAIFYTNQWLNQSFTITNLPYSIRAQAKWNIPTVSDADGSYMIARLWLVDPGGTAYKLYESAQIDTQPTYVSIDVNILQNVTVTGTYKLSLHTYACTGDANADKNSRSMQWDDVHVPWTATSQMFESHKKGTNENNFTIDNGTGYFVYVTNNTVFAVSGDEIPSVKMSLIVGWNSVGWFNSTSTDAESLAQSIINCTAISYWNSTLGRFITHPKGEDISNFTVERGKGCLVYLTSNEEWTNG